MQYHPHIDPLESLETELRRQGKRDYINTLRHITFWNTRLKKYWNNKTNFFIIKDILNTLYELKENYEKYNRVNKTNTRSLCWFKKRHPVS